MALTTRRPLTGMQREVPHARGVPHSARDSAEDGTAGWGGLARLRKRVVFERLLARLHAVAPDAWVLKGGFALELRLGAQARTTKDIDVDWAISEDQAVEFLLEAATVTLDDHFEFALERSQAENDLPGGGQRWTVTATLAGREFERVAIDIGFATEPVLKPKPSSLLTFWTSRTSHLSTFPRSRSSSTSQRRSTPTHEHMPRQAQLPSQGPRRPRRDRPHHPD